MLAIAGDQAYVVDAGDAVDGIVQVDLVTEQVTALTSPNTFSSPRGIAIEADGSLVVADREAGVVARVNPDTGQKTTFASGALLDDVYYLAVMPGPDPCEYVRYADRMRFEAAAGGPVQFFDFSGISVDGNGNAAFSNGHDFGFFSYSSLSLANDVTLIDFNGVNTGLVGTLLARTSVAWPE